MIGRLLCKLGFHPWPEIVSEEGAGEWWRCRRCLRLTPTESRSKDGAHRIVGGVVINRRPTVDIAYCPEHGLHGERERCFVCEQPVLRVQVRPTGVVRDTERPDEKSATVDLMGPLRRSLGMPEPPVWDTGQEPER